MFISKDELEKIERDMTELMVRTAHLDAKTELLQSHIKGMMEALDKKGIKLDFEKIYKDYQEK